MALVQQRLVEDPAPPSRFQAGAALGAPGGAAHRAQIAFALDAMAGAAGVPALRAALADRDDGVALAAAWALADRGDRASGNPVLRLACGPRDREGLAALAAARLHADGAADALEKLLPAVKLTGSGCDRVRRAAVIWGRALMGRETSLAGETDDWVKDAVKDARAVAKGAPAPRFLPTRLPWSLGETLERGDWIELSARGGQFPIDPVARAKVLDLSGFQPDTVAWVGAQCAQVGQQARVLARLPGRLALSGSSQNTVEPVPDPAWTGLMWIQASAR